MLILQTWDHVKKILSLGTSWLLHEINRTGQRDPDFNIKQLDTLTRIAQCELLDRYIEQRIETDKVLIEILKDIQGAQLASREMMEKWMEQFWPAAKEFIEENRP